MKKARSLQRSGFLENEYGANLLFIRLLIALVAGVGFEPTTFGL
jgi:hypothetical protein